MSLPNIAKLEFAEDEVIQSQNDNEWVYKTFLWDFEKGDFVLRDGKLVEVEGKEYLKIWIKKTLLTVKNTLIYEGTDYGSEHYSLIGRNFKPSFIGEELKRMIREALIVNPAITGVTNFQFDQEGSILKIEFDVSSIFGKVTEEVRV